MEDAEYDLYDTGQERQDHGDEHHSLDGVVRDVESRIACNRHRAVFVRVAVHVVATVINAHRSGVYVIGVVRGGHVVDHVVGGAGQGIQNAGVFLDRRGHDQADDGVRAR